MSPSAQILLEKALHLEEDDRAGLAAALAESLDHGPPEPGAEGAWDREIGRRAQELDAGTVETIPWSEVRAQLFRGFE